MDGTDGKAGQGSQSRFATTGFSRQLRVGLQVKAVLILSVVVLLTTAVSGWFYFASTRDILRTEDYQRADRLADSLTITAANTLAHNDRASLQRMANGLLNQANIRYICIRDGSGTVMASAEGVKSGLHYTPAFGAVSLSYLRAREPDLLEIGRPVVDKARLVGAVQLALDTTETSRLIARVRRQTTIVVVAIVLCSVPLLAMLIWRVLLPLRRLLWATRQVTEGNWQARAQTSGNDEIGELGGAFNAMTESLQASQQALIHANEGLEQKVAWRTDQLERANRRLQDEMTEKEEFLRAVSHDLGAPLRNIAGMATMIQAKWKEQLPDDVQARLSRIQVNVNAQSGMIQELLELSRVKSRPQRREWVDMGTLLAELRESFEFELRQKGITLTLQPHLPCLKLEPTRIRELFQNLVDNAIKYMGARPDGRIEIGYEPLEGAHRFRVADNGPGVPADQQQSIFVVFRRGPQNAQVPGKGIGLAWVRSIAANYDGRVWVESRPGAGATFFVELHAEASAGAAEAPGRAHGLSLRAS